MVDSGVLIVISLVFVFVAFSVVAGQGVARMVDTAAPLATVVTELSPKVGDGLIFQAAVAA